jgi:hypothetical protein
VIEFREVPHNPRYRVGNDGSVWSRLVRGSKKGRAGIVWRRLKHNLHPGGYHTVCLGRKRQWYIHRLVLEVFVGPCPPGMQCRHLDGNPSNNCLENLAWGTRDENHADMVRHGRRVLPKADNRGERHGMAKLTEPDVVTIRRLASEGMRSGLIASMFDVSPGYVRELVNRVGWKHI